jgi:hypothetical protein
MTYNSKSSKKIVKKKVNKTVKGGMFERIGKLFKMNRTTNNELNNFFKTQGKENPYRKKLNVTPVVNSPVQEYISAPSNAAPSTAALSTAALSNAALSTSKQPNLLNKPPGIKMGGYHKCKHTKKHRK